MTSNVNWRARMRRAREAMGLIQGKLAAAIAERTNRNLSQSEIAQIEGGQREVHWAIVPISEFLGIEPPEQQHDVDDLPDAQGGTQVATSLTPDELDAFDRWAKAQGYVKGRNPNRRKALRALVRALLDDEVQE